MTFLKKNSYQSRENQPDLRRKKIIKACKLITDTLPFEEKRETLANIPNLVKYLLLNWISLKPTVFITVFFKIDFLDRDYFRDFF